MVMKDGALPRWRLKEHSAATNKVNVYASEVLRGVEEHYPHLIPRVRQLLVRSSEELFDDQAAAWLLYACILSHSYSDDPVLLAYRMLRDPKGCKELTTVIKAMGWNRTELGATLCEAQALQGRATGDIDLEAEARYRVTNAVKEKTVACDRVRLGEAIRAIIQRELRGAKVEFEDVDEYWSRRWGWCVNGAHGRALEQHETKWRIKTLTHRVHRRVFAENVKTNPVREWSGVSYFSASKKLEAGKTRALFAGDSATYVAFNHLLMPVEKAWRGERCILDPGKDGMSGVVRRVHRLQSTASVNIMLDYDDFNSQHTTESMQLVFRILCEEVGYDLELSRKLVDSFARGRVFVGGEDYGYSKGTLMSGHRATTFINTVLNEAYIALCTPDLYACNSMHVGDDVFVAAPNMATAVKLVRAVGSSEFRLNPMKQSVGSQTAEFLRLAIGPECARGYVCRSIASIISGNWVTEVRLGALEGLRVMIQAAWALMARSGDSNIYKLLVTSCVRMSRQRKEVVSDLLSGRVALDSGPSLRCGDMRRFYNATLRSVKVQASNKWLADVKGYATEAYLSNHVSPVEKSAIAYVEMSPKRVMLDASYRKTLAHSVAFGSEDDSVTISGQGMAELHGSITVEEALSRRPEKGVLSGYPLVQLVRNGLKEMQLRDLVNMVGGDARAPDVDLEAFGTEARSVVITGWLPYGDACALGGRVAEDVLTVTYPIMM
jgi:hypothetical protein